MRKQLFPKFVGVIACVSIAFAGSALAAAATIIPEPLRSVFWADTTNFIPEPLRSVLWADLEFVVKLPQLDGRLLIGGRGFAIGRFNGDGNLDSSFNGVGFIVVPIWGQFERINALLLQPDGKIIAGGMAAEANAAWDYLVMGTPHPWYPALIRLNSDGTLDRSFNGTGRLVIEGETQQYGALDGLDLQPDGKIVIRSDKMAVARVNNDGTLDRSFVGTSNVAQEIDRERLFRLITAGYTGSWYDPAQSGHGFALEVLEGPPQQLLAYWFTFAPQGGQSWVAALGPIDGNRAVLQGVQTVGTGARFPPNFDAANARQEPWGTLTFTFSDCNHGRVNWNSTAPGYGSGGMDLTRLTLPAGLVCWPAE